MSKSKLVEFRGSLIDPSKISFISGLDVIPNTGTLNFRYVIDGLSLVVHCGTRFETEAEKVRADFLKEYYSLFGNKK